MARFQALPRALRRCAILSAIVLVTVACGGGSGDDADHGSSRLAVNGGRETNVESFRQVVRVRVNGAVVCSGVLVRSHIVLTATHCVKDASESRVEVEVPRSRDRFDAYRVEKIFKQDYRLHNNILVHGGSGAMKVDVGALVLERSVAQDPDDSESPNLPPLPILPTSDASSFFAAHKMNRLTFLEREGDSEAVSPFRIYGYGYTADMDAHGAGWTVGTLRDTVVPLRGRWGMFDEELHVGFRRRLACWVDSGGPLLAMRDGSPYIVGVSSRFFTYDESDGSCNSSDGSIYTDVTARHVKLWLDGIIQQNPPVI
jgi:hypothetical protein